MAVPQLGLSRGGVNHGFSPLDWRRFTLGEAEARPRATPMRWRRFTVGEAEARPRATPIRYPLPPPPGPKYGGGAAAPVTLRDTDPATDTGSDPLALLAGNQTKENKYKNRPQLSRES